MKIVTYLIILATLYFNYLLAGIPKISGTDSIETYQMSEIVVLAERIPAIKTATVHEITKKQIAALDIRDAHQAMEYSPGLYFSTTSKNETTFRLRGFEQRQVNIFLDGIPITIPYDGMVDISQLAGDNIENIRVAKGVPSVQYGANALGGSVNIMTGIPKRSESFNVRLEGSDHGRIFGSLLYHGNYGKLKYLTSFSLDKAQNFKLPDNFTPILNEDGNKRDNSAHEKYSALLKLHYDLNDVHRLGVHFNYIDNWYHVPPKVMTSRPRYWQFPEWKKNVFSLNSRHVFSNELLLRTVWYYDRYRNVLESYDDASYSSQTRRYAFTSIYDDYSFGGIIYPKVNLLPFGTTNAVASLKRDVHRQAASEDDPYQKFSMETWTFGLEQDFQITDPLSAVAGFDVNHLRPVSAEDLTLRDPITLFNGQLSLQYQLLKSTQLHLSVGKKSRFPTLKELYSSRLGRNIPNPNLQAEHSINTEIGINWHSDNFQIVSAFFHNRLQNSIANRQLGENVQQFQNIDEAILQGFEFDIRLKMDELNISFNYTFLDAEDTSPNRNVDYLEYRPTHRLNSVLKYALSSGLSLQMEGSYTADQHYQDLDTGMWYKLNDFALLNAKIGYQFMNYVNIYVRANNLLDRFYYSEAGVPMPGRELISGLRFRL